MERDSLGWQRRRAVSSYVVGAALVAPALLGEIAAGPEFRFLGFSLAVAISAWQGGLGPGALTILCACIASDYFLFGPGVLLSVDTAQQAYALTVFVVGWVAVCAVMGLTHRRLLRDHEVRARAEQAAAHSDRLAQVAGALGRARTSPAVIETAVQESLHALGGDAGMLLLIRDDQLSATVARRVAYDSQSTDIPDELALRFRSPLSDAVQRGAVVAVESADAWVAQYSDVPDYVRIRDYQATLVMPLLVGARTAAVIRLDFRHARTFTPQDLEFASVLGSSAGQALDRARQLEATQQARADAEALRARADQELVERQKTEQALRASETRQRALAIRTRRMHDLTAGLSEAVTVHAVARAVVQLGSPLVGATAASVSLLVEQGTRVESLYAEDHGEPFQPPTADATETGFCATEAIRSGQPVLVPSWVEWQEQYWRSASRAADAAYLSSAVLPLLVDGAPAGVLEFHFGVPVNFDAEYQALLVSVAQHCSQALDRAQLYESAQKARTEAEKANRLKDDFLSMVSHELRTPLNVVVGWSSLLRARSLGADTTARAIQAIFDNAMRQTRLIDDLLDVSRLATGRVHLELHDLDLPTLLEGVVDSIMPAAAVRNITVTLQRMPAVAVLGDRRRLEQVFFNLLDNALKFTPPGGHVAIDATCAEGRVSVCVRDTGVGIAPEFLPNVFDRFRQAGSTLTRHHGGLGLGLAIAKQLVEEHGGTIAAESAGLNLGAVFRVTLAVTARQAAMLPAPPAPADTLQAAAPRLDGIHVLVVDDEPDAREVMTHALHLCGARITGAASAAEAFDIVNHADVDVLLVDLAMPDEDGYSLMRRLRASSNGRIASIPAAAVTARARYADREQALSAGFQHHVVKPVDPVSLARMVQQLAHQGSEAA